MTTLVGLHGLHRSCFPHQVFGRQPPPGAGYKFRDRGVCLWHSRDQVQVGGFVVAEIRSRSAASSWPRSGPGRWLRFCCLLRVSRAGRLASPSPFVGAVWAAGILATVLGFGEVVGAGGLSPCPFFGAVYVVGFLATVRGLVGPRDEGLGIPWPLLGCPGRFFLHVASRFC